MQAIGRQCFRLDDEIGCSDYPNEECPYVRCRVLDDGGCVPLDPGVSNGEDAQGSSKCSSLPINRCYMDPNCKVNTCMKPLPIAS